MTSLNKTILILTDGSWNHSSSRTRAILYFDYFHKLLNLKVKWIPRIPSNRNSIFFKWFIFPLIKRYLLTKRAFFIIFFKFNIVYIQRTFINSWSIRLLKKKGSIIIFDFDDAIYQNVYGFDKRNFSKTIRILKLVNQIIVSSTELYSFCKKQNFMNVEIIPTPVETERFTTFKPLSIKNKITIGWIGSPSTSVHLKSIVNPLIAICNKFSTKVLLIGPGTNFSLQGIYSDIYPWNYYEEPKLLKDIDIGIMPLDSKISYSKGKGGYKLFQYMAAGIPVVASPIGINTEIVIPNENGFLASSEEEWITYLSYLIEHPEERKRMGLTGRKLAEEKYSREVCAKKLISILKPLIKK